MFRLQKYKNLRKEWVSKTYQTDLILALKPAQFIQLISKMILRGIYSDIINSENKKRYYKRDNFILNRENQCEENDTMNKAQNLLNV